MRKQSRWTAQAGQDREEAVRVSRRAIELARGDPLALAMGGFNLAFVEGELDVGEQCIASALSMNTNLAFGWGFGGLIKIWLGESEAALEYMGRALRLSPRDPQWYKAEEPGTYILLERWTDKESVDAHFKSPHLTKLLPQLAECAVERFKVTRLTKLA